MPSPTQADLHVNVPLTNVSIAYMQNANAYISDKIFPRVPVKHQSDMYWKYSKSDWRRTDVVKRAPGTESAGVGWKFQTDTYYADVFAVHKDIDDQVRANIDSNFSLESDATKFVTNQMLLKRDLDWNAKYFKTGVWATEKTGGSDFTKWSDSASDPISNVAQWIIDFRKDTGYAPNVMVLGAHVMQALKNHPDILDRIKYTQKGIVTEDLIASLFEVDRLYTSYATVASVAEMNDAKAQDAAATYDFIAPSKSAMLLYTTNAPSLQTPTAGYTFTWSGYLAGNAQGIRIKRFRMEHIASDRIEAEMTYDQKVVCSDMGVYLGSVVV
jgi:hypothetical protein